MIRFTRDGADRVLVAEQWLPAPPEDVWAFVSSLHHMNFVIPDWIRFEVLTPEPPPLAPGARYDYRLRLFGLPVRWQTLITEAQPVSYFADTQARGPYAAFLHEHWFEPATRDGTAGTLTRDRIAYQPPGGPCRAASGVPVRGMLGALFRRRHARLAELFDGDRRPCDLLPGATP